VRARGFVLACVGGCVGARARVLGAMPSIESACAVLSYVASLVLLIITVRLQDSKFLLYRPRLSPSRCLPVDHSFSLPVSLGITRM
jgi:hypothetical protein